MRRLLQFILTFCRVPFFVSCTSNKADANFRKFKKLYLSATKSMDDVKSSEDVSLLVKQFEGNKVKCITDEEFQNHLALSYE